jgi:hypothetical protein
MANSSSSPAPYRARNERYPDHSRHTHRPRGDVVLTAINGVAALPLWSLSWSSCRRSKATHVRLSDLVLGLASHGIDDHRGTGPRGITSDPPLSCGNKPE